MNEIFNHFLTWCFTNFLQLLICLIWMKGYLKYTNPTPISVNFDLLTSCLVFPFFISIAHYFGLPNAPEQYRVIHLENWSQSILEPNSNIRLAIIFLFLGTTLIYVFQELIPILHNRKEHLQTKKQIDIELEQVLNLVAQKFVELKITKRRGKPLKIFLLDATEPIAALQGITNPFILISRGLKESLSKEELQGVIAHEFSHYYYGGNWKLLAVWVVRSLQFFNPVALIIFRFLVDTRELACDALAANITKNPKLLGSSLEKTYGHEDDFLLKKRIKILMNDTHFPLENALTKWTAYLILGLLLWTLR